MAPTTMACSARALAAAVLLTAARPVSPQGAGDERQQLVAQAQELARDGSRADELLAVAEQLTNLRMLTPAMSAFRRVAELQPSSAWQAYERIGWITSLDTRRWHESLHAFSHAVAIAPNDDYLHSQLAIQLKRDGRAAEALRHYEVALQASPRNTQARTAIVHDQVWLSHREAAAAVVAAASAADQPTVGATVDAASAAVRAASIVSTPDVASTASAVEAGMAASDAEPETEAAVLPAASCTDRREECGKWAASGECSANAPFMETSCPSSCGLCAGRDALCVDRPAASLATDTAAQRQAVRVYATHGAVCFPAVLPPGAVSALLAHIGVLEARTDLVDNTAVKRLDSHETARRINKAVPLADEATSAVLRAALAALAPLMRRLLGCCDPPLLESAMLLSYPGASAQNFHSDTSVHEPHVAHMMKVQVVLTDTVAQMGPLQVKPDTQRTGNRSAHPVHLALPAGSVILYDTRVHHRAGANTLRRRPVYYFSLKGPGVTPTGMRYAIQPEDIGTWRVSDFVQHTPAEGDEATCSRHAAWC